MSKDSTYNSLQNIGETNRCPARCLALLLPYLLTRPADHDPHHPALHDLHDPDLYILDEPTTGLAMSDVHQLIEVLLRLRRNGHTVIIIEHHLDVVKCADWVLDLGPEGGEHGGDIVAEGTPKEVARNKHSYTGKHLKPLL